MDIFKGEFPRYAIHENNADVVYQSIRTLKHHLTQPGKDGLTLIEWSEMRYEETKDQTYIKYVGATEDQIEEAKREREACAAKAKG